MKKSDFYDISIKIFGIYSIINAIELLQPLISIYFLNQTGDFIKADMKPDYTIIQLYNLSFCLFHAILGALLIFKTNTFMMLIRLSGELESKLTISINKETLFEFAFLISGILLIVWSIPQFVIQITKYAQQVNASTSDFRIDRSFIYIYILKCILGISIVLFAPILGKFFSGRTIKVHNEIG